VGERAVHHVDLGRANEVPGEGGRLVVPGRREVAVYHPARLGDERPRPGRVAHEVAVGVALDGVAGDGAAGRDVLGAHVGARAVGRGLHGGGGGRTRDHGEGPGVVGERAVHHVDLGRANEVPGEGGGRKG